MKNTLHFLAAACVAAAVVLANNSIVSAADKKSYFDRLGEHKQLGFRVSRVFARQMGEWY